MEVALPILALGGAYIYSNNSKKENKKQERFTNMGATPQLPNTHILNKNFPKQNQPIDNTNENYVRQFLNPYQTTDKFFSTKIGNTQLPKDVANKEFKSMSGDCFIAKDFTHNNMVPFFGSKVTQASANIEVSALLDNAQGQGSQLIKKVEAAPLFKPQDNVQLANGAPIQTNFYQSRVIPSQRVANVLPWKQEKVAPGLGLGAGTEGAGGFNAGMLDREAWLPPTVDALRSKTNPRVTYSLNGHQGPSVSEVKNMGSIGAVEKNRPDATASLGPQHWLTTTGASLGPKQHPEQIMPETNHCSSEYFGISNNATHQGVYTTSHTEEPHRHDSTECVNINPAVAMGQGPGELNNYGKEGFSVQRNNRSVNCESDSNSSFGFINSAVKGMMAPILDILKPTRKEDVIYNANQLGNVQAAVPSLPLTNPYDTPKTTNKEMTAGKIGMNYLNVSHMSHGNKGGGYESTNTIIKSQQRNVGDSGTHGNVGNVINKQMDTTAWNQQHNNVNKTYQNWPMPGGTQVWDGNINMKINRRDEDRVNNRMTPQDFINIGPSNAAQSIPSAQTFGSVNMPKPLDQDLNCERMNPDILQAFKSNPYAQSLHSF